MNSFHDIQITHFFLPKHNFHIVFNFLEKYSNIHALIYSSAYWLHIPERFFSGTRIFSQRVGSLQILGNMTELPFKQVSSIHAFSPVKYQNVCVFVSKTGLIFSFSSLPVWYTECCLCFHLVCFLWSGVALCSYFLWLCTDAFPSLFDKELRKELFSLKVFNKSDACSLKDRFPWSPQWPG